MAEQRPLTARDVKSTVEGYSEMSDEAFARRFYSDRTELQALGVPLHSQRDEFTGEELYSLRSEQYFLPRLEISDEELAALQTAFHLLDGKFAYAEPLRLALQNLALGRGGFDQPPTETALRVEVRDPDYSPEMQGRLGKLETGISKQRTVRFSYWSISTDQTSERSINPYALYQDNGAWYVVGQDLDREDIRTFRVSRIRGDIRFATRRERDFRSPPDFRIDRYRGRPPWQIGEIAGEARIEVGRNTAWWVERAYGDRGRLEDGVFVTEYASLPQLASWILRQEGRAVPLEPEELRREVDESLLRVQKRHEGPPLAPAAEEMLEHPGEAPPRPASPVAPERFAVLQALLAYLLARCGDARQALIDADEVVERFNIPRESLEEHLSLLNLVNFGGGCYAVYAELHGDVVRVDKELFGDAFRWPPRLTPLEARAIRLALEFVGPMIAAEAHTPLERVRRKLEETFGEFELAQTPEKRGGPAEEDLIATLTAGIRGRLLVELEYLKEGEETPSRRVVEPYRLERRLPHWYVHTWDPSSEGERSFRLDRMRSARLMDEGFEPREEFEPLDLEHRDARRATIWYSPEVARWRVERGDARPLEDGSALSETAVGSADWLVGEIFSYRGEAVVIDPEDLRARIAKRGGELARELGAVRARP
jgi:proteasome accessory factor BC